MKIQNRFELKFILIVEQKENKICRMLYEQSYAIVVWKFLYSFYRRKIIALDAFSKL